MRAVLSRSVCNRQSDRELWLDLQRRHWCLLFEQRRFSMYLGADAGEVRQRQLPRLLWQRSWGELQK